MTAKEVLERERARKNAIEYANKLMELADVGTLEIQLINGTTSYDNKQGRIVTELNGMRSFVIRGSYSIKKESEGEG